MIQANCVILQTNLKSNLHVIKEGESLDYNPKWQPVFISFHLSRSKPWRQLHGKDPALLTQTDVVFENMPARLNEKETRPFQNSAILHRDRWNGQGLPCWVCKCEFTTLTKTVSDPTYATYQFIKFVLGEKQFHISPIWKRRIIKRWIISGVFMATTVGTKRDCLYILRYEDINCRWWG